MKQETDLEWFGGFVKVEPAGKEIKDGTKIKNGIVDLNKHILNYCRDHNRAVFPEDDSQKQRRIVYLNHDLNYGEFARGLRSLNEQERNEFLRKKAYELFQVAENYGLDLKSYQFFIHKGLDRMIEYAKNDVIGIEWKQLPLNVHLIINGKKSRFDVKTADVLYGSRVGDNFHIFSEESVIDRHDEESFEDIARKNLTFPNLETVIQVSDHS